MDAIATTYAQALFQLSLDDKKEDQIFDEIKLINECFNENKEILKIFETRELNLEDKKGILDNIFKDTISHDTFNFLRLLIDKRRINYILEMSKEFKRMYYEYKNIKEAIIYSATALDKDQVDAIKLALENKYESKFVISNAIDESLIGGVKIMIEDIVIDGSIANKLKKLKSSIIAK
ncbi:MAG: F0F1 ATP synthase subunit delta [Bacilli bacterium]|jgi:F-type H+-transporting ATPase subunit delta|nr:F0F1 ATP synthase subunit delta [Bacilli bacterium]